MALLVRRSVDSAEQRCSVNSVNSASRRKLEQLVFSLSRPGFLVVSATFGTILMCLAEQWEPTHRKHLASWSQSCQLTPRRSQTQHGEKTHQLNVSSKTEPRLLFNHRVKAVFCVCVLYVALSVQDWGMSRCDFCCTAPCVDLMKTDFSSECCFLWRHKFAAHVLASSLQLNMYNCLAYWLGLIWAWASVSDKISLITSFSIGMS